MYYVLKAMASFKQAIFSWDHVVSEPFQYLSPLVLRVSLASFLVLYRSVCQMKKIISKILSSIYWHRYVYIHAIQKFNEWRCENENIRSTNLRQIPQLRQKSSHTVTILQTYVSFTFAVIRWAIPTIIQSKCSTLCTVLWLLCGSFLFLLL